uniref:DUF223 domain-containing protein n=1 Tax=Oryza rufipogon TaxID=4529 RepID=A0A0E0QBV1_ORYRU
MGSATKLKQINLGQQNLKVFGLLIRLWDAKNMASASTPTIFSIDGVILDEEGTMMQFTIPKKLENEFRPSLTLGCVYMFVDVNTADIKNKKYIYHHQKYMLQFKSSTKVHHLESRGSSIPNYGFEFCPFDQIPSKSRISKPLIDLIGVISHVGPYDYAGKTSSKKNRKLKIRNKDEQEQGIVLWGEYGESFDEAFVLQKSTDHKIVVAILAGLTAGTYLGKTEATSSLATQIYFDSDITEIVEYQSRYKLPLTIKDESGNESGTLDAVAFYNVAEDLVEESATKQLATDEGLTTMEHYSKEDQHPTTPPSLQPPETTLDNNTVNQIIPSAKRALQFEKELHIDQPSPAIANTIQVATNQLYHPQQVDLSKEKQPSTEFSPGQNSKRHKKVMEASTNGEENQLQQPKIADQQPSGHKEQVQLIHTNYLQAVSKIIASKSTAISITLQGKSSTDDLSKLQPTQAHVVNYMKNKLPHMHIILDGENVKNNEIYNLQFPTVSSSQYYYLPTVCCNRINKTLWDHLYIC